MPQLDAAAAPAKDSPKKQKCDEPEHHHTQIDDKGGCCGGCFVPTPLSYAATQLKPHQTTAGQGIRKTLHQYSFTSLIGNEIIRLSEFAGKVVLIINVASHCNATNRSYLQLNELSRKYPDLVILGCPCNQFGHQENLYGEEILTSLKYIRPGNGFVPNFRLTEKLEVNGANAHAVFNFLKLSLPSPCDRSLLDEMTTSGGAFSHPMRVIWMPVSRCDLTWNFEKFLIGPDGIPFRRYSPRAEVMDMEEDIKKLMGTAVEADGAGAGDSTPSATEDIQITRKRSREDCGC